MNGTTHHMQCTVNLHLYALVLNMLFALAADRSVLQNTSHTADQTQQEQIGSDDVKDRCLMMMRHPRAGCRRRHSSPQLDAMQRTQLPQHLAQPSDRAEMASVLLPGSTRTLLADACKCSETAFSCMQECQSLMCKHTNLMMREAYCLLY